MVSIQIVTTVFYFLFNRDTAGQERFASLSQSFYRNSQGIMIVYDVTNSKSFENVSRWLRNIEEV